MRPKLSQNEIKNIVKTARRNGENPDLSGTNLSGTDLFMANLGGANLSGADLSGADLNEADLSGANLEEANLEGADLERADLERANLRGANLSGAHLGGADLTRANMNQADLTYATLVATIMVRASLKEADLSEAYLTGGTLLAADLSNANLSGANLIRTNLSGGQLRGTDLSYATLWNTTFNNIDLSQAQGLDTINHQGPSSIDVETIYRSSGKIPPAFLRGIGVANVLFEHIEALQDKTPAHACFISYSMADEAFAQQLYNMLQENGIRCWTSSDMMKIGDDMQPRLDETIRRQDKLLLILSENSVRTPWIQHEVEHALHLEQERGESVLVPIRLDDAVLTNEAAWAGKIRERQVRFFENWEDANAYQTQISDLLTELKG